MTATALLLTTSTPIPVGGGRGVEITFIPHAAQILWGTLVLGTLCLLAWWELRKTNRKDRE